jgi:hypothetical protein
MCTARTIIIRTILALSAAGSIAVGAAVPVMAVQASSVQVVAAAPSAHPNTFYRG